MKILITGKNSYVGTSLEKWLSREPAKYEIKTADMIDGSWEAIDFSIFDVVFHVAAVVHKKERRKSRDIYFKVNRDLAVEVAHKAKKSGVKQFVFMSSMAVFGEIGKVGEDLVIHDNTPVNPKSFYAESKAAAERAMLKLKDEAFKIVILRPPMVYGHGCPGNYSLLEKLALKSPVFPMIENKRSMISIDKLCQEIKYHMDNESSGTFHPQDDKYVNTSLLVKEIALNNGKKIHLSRAAGAMIVFAGRNIGIIKKVFGNLVYSMEDI